MATSSIIVRVYDVNGTTGKTTRTGVSIEAKDYAEANEIAERLQRRPGYGRALITEWLIDETGVQTYVGMDYRT